MVALNITEPSRNSPDTHYEDLAVTVARREVTLPIPPKRRQQTPRRRHFAAPGTAVRAAAMSRPTKATAAAETKKRCAIYTRKSTSVSAVVYPC